MRVFQNLTEALKEIRRDLSKAPVIRSTRVQNLEVNMTAREAMGYHYTILSGGIPQTGHELVDVAAECGLSFYQDKSNRELTIDWLEAQWSERWWAEEMYRAELSDFDHPALATVKEGEHYGYTYQERMVGSYGALEAALSKHPDTRRAFWPIYNHFDAIRASYPTRIPCSIGIQLMRRTIPGKGEVLHAIYMQRSADYEIFLATDIFLWAKFQRLMGQLPNLRIKAGAFEHFICSLHWFNREGTEIY